MNERKAQVRAANVLAEFIHHVNPDVADALRDRIAGAILRAFEDGENEPNYDRDHGLREGFER